VITLVDASGKRHRGLSCELSMPVRGNWVAHVETGDDVAPEGAVTLEIARDNGAGLDTFTGTVRHGAPWAGRSEVVVVGGAGGLLAQLEPRHYAPRTDFVPPLLVAQQLVADAGEELSPDVAAALEGRKLGRFTRARLPAVVLLGLLADGLGLGWRVLADGTVWIGEETWPDATSADLGREMVDRGDDRIIEIAPDRATLRPGVTAFGQRITRVTYQLGGNVRAKLGYGEPDRDDAAAAVRGLLPQAVYSQSVAGRVVAQHDDDDTLDLELDDPRLPALTRIPFRPGLPGVRVLFPSPGAVVRVSFENGSPAGAFAWGPDQHKPAHRGLARVGDTISCGFYKVTGAGDLVKTSDGAPGAIEIKGFITGGSEEVLVR